MKSARGSASSVPVPADARSSPEAVQARLVGAVLGGFSGFFVGGIVGILGSEIFFHTAGQGGPGFLGFVLVAGVFFGGILGGLLLGMFLGRRALAGPIERALRRRQERSPA